MPDVVVFTAERAARPALDALLDEHIVTWGPRRRTTVTVLDTFDGRLHAAGLRLDLVGGGGRRLELAEHGDRQPLPGRSLPRFAADLGAGPVAATVVPLIGNRAVLVQAEMSALRTDGVVEGGDDEPDCRLVLVEQPKLDGAATSAQLLLEVHAVAGRRRKARRLEARLHAAGFERHAGDAVALLAATSGRSLVGHVNFPVIALDPDAPSAAAFRQVLLQLARTVDANWDGVVRRTDPEFLHDFRVAIRRTRSILAAGRQVLPDIEADLARVRLGRLAAETSAARDLDVYLEAWPKHTADLDGEVVAALEPLHRLVEARSNDEHARAAVALLMPEARAVVEDWQRWLETSQTEAGSLGHQPLGATVAQLVLRAHRQLLQRGRLITPETRAEQLHDLRKDAKRLRYLLECFGSLMPADPLRRFVKRLKVLQDNLGEHQDAEVQVLRLTEFAAELQSPGTPPGTLVAVGRLIERADARCLAARASFAWRFAEYDGKDTTRALFAAIDHIH